MSDGKEDNRYKDGLDHDLFEEDFSEEDLDFTPTRKEVNKDEINKRPAWIGKSIAMGLAIVLLINVLAFWPKVYSLPAIQFLIKSYELSKMESIQQYKKAVVTVQGADKKGTGFNIISDGLIITNHHVIEGLEKVYVHFNEGDIYEPVHIQKFPEIDIAILDIEPSKELPYLEVNTRYNAQDFEHVYVIGNPLYFSQIANEGEIVGESSVSGWDVPVTALDAPIYKGNSGSPVINKNGEVVAVVFAKNTTHNLGLAVPLHYFDEHLPQEVIDASSPSQQ